MPSGFLGDYLKQKLALVDETVAMGTKHISDLLSNTPERTPELDQAVTANAEQLRDMLEQIKTWGSSGAAIFAKGNSEIDSALSTPTQSEA